MLGDSIFTCRCTLMFFLLSKNTNLKSRNKANCGFNCYLILTLHTVNKYTQAQKMMRGLRGGKRETWKCGSELSFVCLVITQFMFTSDLMLAMSAKSCHSLLVLVLLKFIYVFFIFVLFFRTRLCRIYFVSVFVYMT